MSRLAALSQRLEFLKFDGRAKSDLAKLKSVVMGVLPKALDGFYDKIRATPELAKFFNSEAHIVGARNRQLAHWDTISSGKFDENYWDAVAAVGETHARVGLEPHWYISGYTLILDELVSAAIEARWPKVMLGGSSKQDEARAQISALIKATLLDMEIAISCYSQRREQIHLAAKEADREQAEKEQQEVMEALGSHLRTLAAGNLSADIENFFPEKYRGLRMDFNQAVHELSATLRDIRDASESVANSANALAYNAGTLSHKTETQAATLEETAAAHDQVTATVRRSMDLARETADLATDARASAEESRVVVAQATSAIRSIEHQSQQINQIIGVIDEIAFQTNLLALNAGVEAARAGESGRGFAVVAQEVRALAQRSAEAAKEIKSLISKTSEAVKNGVELVDRSGSHLNHMVDQVAAISERVVEISAASKEQTLGLEEVNKAISELDSVTQSNAHVAVEAANAAAKLTEESTQLASAVQKFKLDKSEAGVSMDLDKAAAAHVQWKAKLLQAINGREKLDVSTISADNCCPLGKWLHGDAKLEVGRSSVLSILTDRHAQFHCEAGRVANLINGERMDEARGALQAGTPFAAATQAVGLALEELKRAGIGKRAA